ncbi:MAG: hypothetical protein JXP73_21370 [Deltaproteobacteria bacterium]|nr:hypothetical protein [Deltaproteobacteria bacterium]
MNFGIRITKSYFGAVLASLFFSPWLAACGGNGETSPSGNAHIKDENNYTVTTGLTIPVKETQPGADLEICWDKVTNDFMSHPLTEETRVKAVHWGDITRLTVDQIEEQFANGTFDNTKWVKKIRTLPVPDPSKTCGKLSEFHTGESYLMPEQDYVVSNDNYMLLFASSEIQGKGIRSAMFIKPVEGSTVTKVDGVDGGPMLDFSADLDKPKVDIPAAGPWEVEWSQLTRDAVGEEVPYQKLDNLRLGFYPNMTATDLSAQALDYDRIPGATFYNVAIVKGARSANLADAKTKDGQAFSGFDQTDGLWLVAIECSECYLPAPVAVVGLNPI